MPRQFAFFLPQFHTIPENDEWWGKGFTEWVKVKGAKPLYKGHIQPKLPEHDNYYMLLDKEVVKWQTDLMKKYHVDGMIYYHYYFSGKMLLEKPAENLLAWKDIDQPFFFCWANHSWFRSWEGTKELLIGLEYGDENDWEKHFRYLLPFFKDERYEKKDGKPLFMVFDSDFAEKEKMFEYFSKRCKEEGFNGICVIESRKKYNGPGSLEAFKKQISSNTDYIFEREPLISRWMFNYSIKYTPLRVIRAVKKRVAIKTKKGKPTVYSGNRLYKEKLKNETPDEHVIHGTFFEWDNTPRHGYRGSIITPVSKELYMEYMDKVKDEEYIFINAWNEWAEGMMLEPTQCNGDSYLQWISEWAQKNSKH